MFGDDPTPEQIAAQQRLDALHLATQFSIACANAGASVSGANVRVTADAFADFLANGGPTAVRR